MDGGSITVWGYALDALHVAESGGKTGTRG
jgi:hypothetical protein